MLSMNNFIKECSYKLYISNDSDEKEKIDTSIGFIIKNLESYFKEDIKDVKIFGSFKRDTILPRKYDENSDIDLLVIFDEENINVKPETYRNYLKDFAKFYYSSSDIVKDHPSVVIELQHIKFDLVPAIIKLNWFEDEEIIYIPDKYNDWQKTNPDGFSGKLSVVNSEYNYIVKPIIRLLKYWNASVDYPYDSFFLEQMIAKMDFTGDNYEEGFFYAINNLETYELSEYSYNKVSVLQNNAEWVKKYLDRENWDKAIQRFHKIIP